MQRQEIALDPYRREWLEGAGFLERRILMLALHYWINLAEPPARDGALYQDLGLLLHTLVRDGKLICPVSPSLLMELRKQPPGERHDVIARLMDALSCGLALRSQPIIFREELACALAGNRPERHIAFSATWDAFAPLTLNLAGSTLSVEQVSTILRQFYMMMARTSILELWKDKGRILELENAWIDQIAEANAVRVYKKLSTTAILRAEFIGAVRASLLQQAQAMLRLTAQGKLLDPLSDKDVKELLDSCPTFWREYHMIAALRSEVIKPNDLWDAQFVISAPSYVDCLACDRAMWHRCTQVLRLDRKFGLTIVAKTTALRTWLESLN